MPLFVTKTHMRAAIAGYIHMCTMFRWHQGSNRLQFLSSPPKHLTEQRFAWLHASLAVNDGSEAKSDKIIVTVFFWQRRSVSSQQPFWSPPMWSRTPSKRRGEHRKHTKGVGEGILSGDGGWGSSKLHHPHCEGDFWITFKLGSQLRKMDKSWWLIQQPLACAYSFTPWMYNICSTSKKRTKLVKKGWMRIALIFLNIYLLNVLSIYSNVLV